MDTIPQRAPQSKIPKNPVYIVCQTCGKTFATYPYRAREGNRFCSIACRPTIKPLASLEVRFWAKVQKTDNCWLWLGRTRGGYGRIAEAGRGSRVMSAHRVSYELAYGPIPDGLDVLHICDNPSCVWPEHLRVGTHTDNMRDMALKGRGALGARNGRYTHPERNTHGERSWTAKLTAADVVAIRARFVAGNITCAQLAREYGVDFKTISSIVQRRSWKHLPETLPGG